MIISIASRISCISFVGKSALLPEHDAEHDAERALHHFTAKWYMIIYRGKIVSKSLHPVCHIFRDSMFAPCRVVI